MPRETAYMGNGVCKTVFMTTGRDGRGMIMEQYSRSPMADPELKMELVMEVPTDTVRELLAQLGGLRETEDDRGRFPRAALSE